MVGAEGRIEESEKRAELFEILAHQTRIRMLKALEGRSLSFAELKRELAIESSGNLQHHLGKLGDLIKQTDDGKYAITDDAREALRILDVMQQTQETVPTGVISGESRKTKLRLLGLIATSMVLLFIVFYEYSLLVKSVPLFDPFDFSKVLDMMGEKYDYLMLTTANLQNGTRIAFRGAVFTYIDRAHYLYLARSNVTVVSGRIRSEVTLQTGRIIVVFGKPAENVTGIVWSLVYDRYFRVEFEDGEVDVIPILPWPYSPFVAYSVRPTGSHVVALYNVSRLNEKVITIKIADLYLIPLEEASRAYAFQIGPETIMLLVRCDR